MCVCSIYTHTYNQSIYIVALMLQLEAHQKKYLYHTNPRMTSNIYKRILKSSQ